MSAAWILAAVAVVLVAHTMFALRARKRDVKAEKVSALEAIPDGILVTHAPNPAKATRNGRSGMEFTWTFQTALASTVGELTIVEFGTLWWNGAQWQPGATVFGRPFTVAEFADWYACPNASLKRGTTYVDEQNYTGSDELKPSTSTWYFIGEGPDKQRYKGVAVVKLLAEVEDGAHTQQGAAPRGK